nr:MAG TPA: hypothetical protein [Caudoviricetes sp.]
MGSRLLIINSQNARLFLLMTDIKPHLSWVIRHLS